MRYMRNPAFIYSALALAGTALIILAVAPLASKVVERWSQRDIELRSRLIFNTIRDQVVAGLASASSANLVPVFERIAEDERVLGLGFCNEAGQLAYATAAFRPASIAARRCAPRPTPSRPHPPKGIGCWSARSRSRQDRSADI